MYVGVDGCKSGWVAIWLDDFDFIGARAFTDFAALMDVFVEAEVLGVDTPIGLSTDGDRQADSAAREYLRGQASSVFSAPVRAVLDARSHAEATEISRRVCGKGLSQQTFNIVPKIREVDAFAADHRIREIHPEVTFRLMNGGDRLLGKKTWGGLQQRLALLRNADIVIPEDLGDVGKVGIDDIVDAAGAAWSARRIAKGDARCFPAEPGQKDGQRTVAIWA